MRADGVLAWWSPDPRGVIPLDGFHVSRSLRARDPALRDPRRHRVRRGDARRAPIRAGRTAGSTSRSSRRTRGCTSSAGRTASRRGATTSSSAGSTALRIGGLFAGESMFHRVTDASKVACWATVELLRLDGARAVRRAVDDAAPAVAGRGRRDARRVPARLLAVGGSVTGMADVTVFHNQACSKSRGALEILEERGVDARRRALPRHAARPRDDRAHPRRDPRRAAGAGAHRRRQVQGARDREGRRARRASR